jgi:uroporphyrinogen-III synthase
VTKILLLRSGIEEGAESPPEGVDLLLTHEVISVPQGIAAANAFEPAGASLIVTSRSTVLVLEAARPGFFAGFERAFASGTATGRALSAAGARQVEVGAEPGAAGIVPLLRDSSAPLLWPHGSDADPEPFEPLAERSVRWSAPVVYEKRPLSRPDPGLVRALLDGRYAGVAVSSVAALDVLLGAVRASGRPLPQVRWGAIGPGTARAFAQRHLPAPVVPSRARLTDLVDSVTAAIAAAGGGALRKEQ